MSAVISRAHQGGTNSGMRSVNPLMHVNGFSGGVFKIRANTQRMNPEHAGCMDLSFQTRTRRPGGMAMDPARSRERFGPGVVQALRCADGLP